MRENESELLDDQPEVDVIEVVVREVEVRIPLAVIPVVEIRHAAVTIVVLPKCMRYHL